jgi:hypothetical protein
MRLFFHFSNLYDGHHKTRLAFPKRYDDICTEWLGGLTVQKHQSVIERDQLGPHLRQLVHAGVLASYAITRAKTRDGFVITFRPGAAFFADYDRFYRHRTQAEFQFDFHTDQRDISEPLKLAYAFTEKRTGRKRSAISYVSSKEVETAKDLLDQIPAGEGDRFLDYALAEARLGRQNSTFAALAASNSMSLGILRPASATPSKKPLRPGAKLTSN